MRLVFWLVLRNAVVTDSDVNKIVIVISNCDCIPRFLTASTIYIFKTIAIIEPAPTDITFIAFRL